MLILTPIYIHKDRFNELLFCRSLWETSIRMILLKQVKHKVQLWGRDYLCNMHECTSSINKGKITPFNIFKLQFKRMTHATVCCLQGSHMPSIYHAVCSANFYSFIVQWGLQGTSFCTGNHTCSSKCWIHCSMQQCFAQLHMHSLIQQVKCLWQVLSLRHSCLMIYMLHKWHVSLITY